MSPIPSPTDQPPTDQTSAGERREVEAMLRHFASSQEGPAAIYRLLDAQLAVLHGRAQSLIQLAGVVISVTGFSGRVIADTSRPAQILVVSGVSLVALAAALALMFVMPIRWLTADLYLPAEEWLLLTLRRRNRKERAIRIAFRVLIVGMTLYLIAISLMLLHPEAAELKRVR